MKTVKGFSLIEIMVVIAIISILASMTESEFSSLIKKYKIKSEVNKWHLALNLARQSAITSNHIVTLCPSLDGINCGSTWPSGAIIFVDINKNHDRDVNELILQTIEPAEKTHTISWRAFQNRNYVQFQQNGFTWNQNGTLRICNNDPSLKYNRALIVTRSGRIRLSIDSDDDGVEEDAQGNKISC